MQTPLHVMQLVLSLEIGGMEKLVYDMVRRFDPQMICSSVCCLDCIGSFGEALQREGYRVYALNRKPGHDWGLIPRLSRRIIAEKVDILHAQQYTAYFYGLLASCYGSIRRAAKFPKLVYTSHGIPYPYEKHIKRFVTNPVLCRFAKAILTISEDTRANLVRYENVPAHKIQVVYNGIDLRRFSQQVDIAAKKQSLGLAPESKIIGIVARLDPVKNHTMLLRALQRVLQEQPDTQLLIVGHGPEESRLKTLVEALGVSQNTHFLGMREDVPELLHIFDIATLSSFGEGMSVTLLEAMGAGVPVVATNVGGNPEVVKDQETGYLVPSDDDQAMAAMLLTLLRDDDLRRRIGYAGQQRAKALFSLEKMVETYTTLYVQISSS